MALPLSLPVRRDALGDTHGRPQLWSRPACAYYNPIAGRSASVKNVRDYILCRGGIGRDLHLLRVCGHVIVGYNVAIGGDEEAGTFADHHTLPLLAFGIKNLKEHQMRGATTA